jgi:hypothetical protein
VPSARLGPSVQVNKPIVYSSPSSVSKYTQFLMKNEPTVNPTARRHTTNAAAAKTLSAIFETICLTSKYGKNTGRFIQIQGFSE